MRAGRLCKATRSLGRISLSAIVLSSIRSTRRSAACSGVRANAGLAVNAEADFDSLSPSSKPGRPAAGTVQADSPTPIEPTSAAAFFKRERGRH